MSGRDIEALKAAMERTQARMTYLWRSVSYPGQDEHHAALGGCNGEYHQLSEKQERRRVWLIKLLRKRGRPDDLQLAQRVENHVWPDETW